MNIKIYPIRIASEESLTKEVVRISNLSMTLGYIREDENRLLTRGRLIGLLWPKQPWITVSRQAFSPYPIWRGQPPVLSERDKPAPAWQCSSLHAPPGSQSYLKGSLFSICW
jgi:hypothetical protein